jgi:hypothetical protein
MSERGLKNNSVIHGLATRVFHKNAMHGGMIHPDVAGNLEDLHNSVTRRGIPPDAVSLAVAIAMFDFDPHMGILFSAAHEAGKAGSSA